jgi:MFS family permease
MNAILPSHDRAAHRSDLERSLRLCVVEGITAMPIVTLSLPANVVLTALFALTFPQNKISLGIIWSVPFLANFLQVFVLPLITRGRTAKRLTVFFAILHWLSWVLLIPMLSWLPGDDPVAAGAWFALWFFVSSCFSSVTGVSWSAWMQEWVPPPLRGKFFGRRNAVLQISTLLFVLGSGWILTRLEYAITAYQVVIGVAVLFRVPSLFWLAASPTRPHRRHTAPPVLPLREQFRHMRRSHSLPPFIAFGALWAFAANCFGPFYHVFMLEELNLSTFDVGIFVTLSQLGGALSLPAWGRLLDRHGNKSVMVASLLLWQLPNFAWYFIEPGNTGWLYIIWTWIGIAGAGFILGQFTLLIRLVPVEARHLAIGVNLAVVSLVAAAAPIIGGWALYTGFRTLPDRIQVYHLSFLLLPILAIAAAPLLLRVQEPRASSLTMVFGAMRNVRTLSAMVGLGFLVNYVFFRPSRKVPARRQ